MRDRSLIKPLPRLMKSSGSWWIPKGILFLWLAILGWQLYGFLSARNVWADFLLIFFLFGYLALTALGIGRILVRQFNLSFSNLEFNLLASLFGLGLLSMSIMAIGMIGWLNKTGIFASLTVIGFFASFEWNGILRSAAYVLRKIHLPRNASIYEILLFILIAALFPLLIVNALTPVWDYDGLAYHMEIPKQFLLHGRIYFDPDVMRSAHPFLGEMLFLVGMIFRVDSLAKFINLTFAILFIFSIYAFASRFFSRDAGLVAIGILVSTPIVSVWATWASVDFGWAVYEFWAVYAVWLWLGEGKANTEKWLALAGIMSGLGASTKYLSLAAFLILGLLILWKSAEGSKHPFSETFRNLLIFGCSAGIVMGTWYVKNWIWTGNPIYPFLFGGKGWDALKDQIFTTDYMKTFGMERNLLNFILLPYNVYAQHSRFSTLPLEIIHPLLWLAFLFPFIRKQDKYSAIVLYTFIYYIWWFFGYQQIRFLLPVSGFLVIFAGSVLEGFHPYLKNILKIMLIPVLMVFILVYQLSVLRNSGTFSYITGQTSSEKIFQNFVDDYRVKEFIQQSLPENARVVFLWDSRGYYCDSRCISDSNQSQAVELAVNSPPPEKLAQELGSKGITYILLHSTDAKWFVQYHDPDQYHRLSLEYYQDRFLPSCGKSIFRDEGVELFEITCGR